MYSFKCDYSELAHPSILRAMLDVHTVQEEGYGEDSHSENARKLIKKVIGREDIDVHFIPGGTQANFISISAFLRPHESVVAAETAHICVHETGAVEATGHKICTVANGIDGKVTPDMIKPVLIAHEDEHMVKPRLVKISNATEIGTVYTKAELSALSQFCKENNLLFYCDGARLASALTSEGNDVTLKDMAELLDAFYIGGTKNGALLGEALVIVNDSLKSDFRYFIKQKGAMLAKGTIMGIQFEEFFKGNLYFDLAKHANKMAALLTDGLKKKGHTFYVLSNTNQIFPILPNDTLKRLRENYAFYDWRKIDENSTAIRLVTSWATREEDMLKFIEAL